MFVKHDVTEISFLCLLFGVKNYNVLYFSNDKGGSMGVFSRRLLLKSLIPSTLAAYVGVSRAKDVEKNISKAEAMGSDKTAVYVDDFGADSTGATDSTAAVMAAIESISGVTNSRYTPESKRYLNVIFGEGVYIIGDIPFISGVMFSGLGRWATRIVPKEGSAFAFNTVDTVNYAASKGNTRMRLIASGIKDMSIGCELQDINLNKIPKNSGGIRLSNASYFILENVVIRSLDGCGLRLEEVWDSDFSNVRIMHVGNTRKKDASCPGMYIGPGDNDSDGSNALRFRGLHIEDCPQLLQIDERSRHLFFTSPKLEGTRTKVSNTITGGIGITFDCPELTWQYPDKPMFVIDHKNANEGVGIVFNCPSLISSDSEGKNGWYFLHKDNPYGYLSINNPFIKSVSKLFEGGSVLVNGGSGFASGPSIIRSYGQSHISNLHLKFVRPQKMRSQDYTIHLSGEANTVKGCSFESSDGFANFDAKDAVIYLDETCINNMISENIFFGSRDYGIKNDSNYNNFINSNITSEKSKYKSVIDNSGNDK